MDQGPVMAFVEYATVRVECPSTGRRRSRAPGRARLPLHARVRAAGRLARMQVLQDRHAELMRIDWASVGGICRRVYDELDAEAGDRFDGLVRIGIDETSYKKGHKYMTVVLDHDANRVVWCAKGHGKAVLKPFFEQLSEDQRASIRVVTADGARWIAELAESYCPLTPRGSWTPSTS